MKPDYKERLRRLKKEMAAKEMDALLVVGSANRRYLSGSAMEDCFLVVTQEKDYVLTDFRNIEEACVVSLHLEGVTLDREYTVFSFLKELTPKKLGVEEGIMTVSFYRELTGRNGLPEEGVTDAGGMIEKLRAVKDESEIEYIKSAEALGDRCFTHMLSFLKPGITEREGAAEIQRFFLANGAERLSFDTICLFGERTSMPHGSPSERKLKSGDLVTMDFGCVLNGYCSDMTRTIAIGEIGKKEKEIYNTVLSAQIKALSSLRDGLSCKEADNAARSVIEEAGYGEYFGHGLGHGVGLEIHEAPTLNSRSEETLQTNMVVTAEPGIYIPGECGVRIEDLAVITSSGIINLVQSEKELIVL